jgi:cytochrome P450
LKEMHRWFWAFGSGGRMCIGSHLAMQEMKLIVCALLGNYEVEIAEGGDEGIEAIDAYTVRPRSNRLMMRWKAARW